MDTINIGVVGVGLPEDGKALSCRTAVTGIGNMGSYHARRIYDGRIRGLTLTAVCDTNPDRLAWARETMPGVACFSSHRDMLDSGVADAVVIATPHYYHCPIAIDCFAAGLHVLCEKPAGVYTAQVREMNEAAAAAGTVFSLMFNQRTDPLYCKVKQLLEAGALGRLQRLSWTVTNWYRTQAYYDSAGWRATWAGEGGGVLLNQAVHNIDLWQWLFGMPAQLTGFCRFGRYHDIEVEDDVTLYAAYVNGATATFIASTGEFPGTNRLEIAGERGKLVAESGGLTLWRSHGDFTESRPEAIPIPAPAGPVGHDGILENFADAIHSGAPLIAPGADGIRSLEIINAALLSAWEGAAMTLPVDCERYLARLKEKMASSTASTTARTASPPGEYSRRWDVKW